MKNLSDIAKETLDKINAEMQNEADSNLNENVSNLNTTSSNLKSETVQNASETTSNLNENGGLIENERIFLTNVKERLGVLFEGLNAGGENTELRLDLTVKFLEFLLANVENRLKNLPR